MSLKPLEHSFTLSSLEMQGNPNSCDEGFMDSPPHTTPACDALPCLTSLLHSFLSHPQLDSTLPVSFSAALLGDGDGDGDGGHAAGASDEPDSATGNVEGEIEEGVPRHPLYVHLAAALYRWIITQQFPRSLAPMPGINEDESWKANIDTWTAAVVTQGSMLLQLWRRVSLQLDVQEPYSISLRDGFKTVEGRCATDAYRSLQRGHLVLVNGSFLLQVKELRWYPTFKDMLEAERLASVLPGVNTISEGIKVYRKFYNEEKERARGVLGIHVTRPIVSEQPVEPLANILNVLGVEGVRALLGMRTTVGSIHDALPPPKSALVASFNVLNNPDVAGSRITVGARALSKHVPRSLSSWWGSFSGAELERNELAKKTLHHLMKHTTWINVHMAPFPLFEIRVGDGYGARWLADGSQFRGFLEPPMDEGYSKKWRH